MSAATYTPTIVEASPRSDRQREAAARGHKGYRVSASGNTRINGMKVVAYLVQVMPDGYLKCYCQAGKLGRECSHKQAVRQHMEQQPARLTCSSCGKEVPDRGQLREPAYVCEACKRTAPGSQMAFACARPRHETAILASHTPEGFSIFRT